MKNQKSKNRTMNCVSGSVLIHASLAVALALAAPQLADIPEAISGQFLEFEASAPNVSNIVEVAIAETTPQQKAPVVAKKPAAPKPKTPKAKPDAESSDLPVVKVKKESQKPAAPKKPAVQKNKPVKAAATVKPKAAPNTIDDGELPAELKDAKKELEKAKEELLKAQRAEEERKKNDKIKEEMAAIKLEAEKIKQQAEQERIEAEKAKELAAAQLAAAEAKKQKEELARQKELEEARRAQEAQVAAAQAQAEKAQAEAQALKEQIAQQKAEAQAQAEAARRNAEIERQLAQKKAQNARQGVPSGTQSFYDLRQAPGNIPPEYTSQARLAKQQGRGQLYYYVTKDGRVTKMRMTKSTGHPTLDSLAAGAFSKYKFVPGQEGWTVHNFEFNLKGEAQPNGGRLRTSN